MSNSLTPGNNLYTYTGTIVTVTVTTSGVYDVVAYGAQGGADGAGTSGGKGAEIGGDVTLTAGETLEIVVGGAGATVSRVAATGAEGAAAAAAS